MSERKTACNTYRVEYVCDECGTGTMEASGKTLDTYPPQYKHICNSCGHEGYLETRYPEIRYEPIEALEKHVKEQAQATERERIKSRVKEAAENLWCIRNEVVEEVEGELKRVPYSLYIGPSLNTMEEFVDRLLEEY